MKKITIDGNGICSRMAYLFTEVSGIYPITPSSTMAENVDKMSSNKEKNIFGDIVKVVEMQSEAGAAGLIHGALESGTLATTFTASQGLLLMIPNMYKMSGEMLPAVFHVAARSLSTHALSIMGDHQDIYAVRSTGFAMIASSNVQDIAYLTIVAHLSAISSSIPVLHFFDGFRTSHEIAKINMLEKDELIDLVPNDKLQKFRNRSLNPNNPNVRGTNQNDDIYFQITESRNKDYENLVDIVEDYMNKINEKVGTNYKPFNYYGSKTAKKVIIAMGSVNDTIKEVIDNIGGDIGLIEVHLYRPFSKKHLLNVLPSTVEKIAVLDRTKEPCSREPLYLDVVDALKDENITIVGGRYGLSGKNTNPSQIKAVFDMLDNPVDNFTIGINDNVTNLSLKETNFKINDTYDILIYGYGSDGMVSLSKSIIDLVGENTNKFVQGYNEYDSKKSGGITISHLRFSDKEIHKPYYVENPSVIVISKDKYLSEIDLFSNIKENGKVLINTNKSKEELLNYIKPINLKNIKAKNLQIYIIDALKESSKLNGKINMLLSLPIISLTDLIDINKATDYFKHFVEYKYVKAGKEMIKNNKEAIDNSLNLLKKIELNGDKNIKEENLNFYESLYERLGNNLSVKEVLDFKDGVHIPYHKHNEPISDLIPNWISENCVQCNQCSFVCPNNVIKPFLLSEEEYNNSPNYIKENAVKCKNPLLKDYYFIIGINARSCTGCKVCINTCPGFKNNKALDLVLNNNEEQIKFDYLIHNIKNKNILSDATVIGCAFKESGFTNPSSCAGCGEVGYLKILTQLFKDKIIIANATGCSSIYGGTLLNNPYSIPWTSSLFEDNAEFGYGILIGNHFIKNRIANYMLNHIDENKLYKDWLQNPNDKKISDELISSTTDDVILSLKDYLYERNVWIVGGDGWAYDIGFGGIDHILSSNDNVNILVLDTGAYSNTGGQASKSTPMGAIASFASSGKKTNKKDLVSIAMNYPNCYVATISLGANMVQTIKAFKEANNHNGPSIIIAYSLCITHGIKDGMQNSILTEKLAVESGFFPLIRYNPNTNTINIDSKNIDFNKYNDFIESQTRFTMLKEKNIDKYNEFLELSKKEAIERLEKYKNWNKK